ncbi:hypothetical protein [Rhodopirellula sallentina]|nr:hypothetical protein [Rhodopirellula sallentina]
MSPENSLDSAGSAPPSSSVPGPAVAEIVLAQSRFENVREGYQALQWNEIEGASRYQVLDADGYSYYDGTLTEAFISGLPDGEHTFEIQAFSADNVLVGVTDQPAVIEVHHWPMSQAWASFAVGLVVFLAMIGLIIVGATRSSTPSQDASGSGADS